MSTARDRRVDVSTPPDIHVRRVLGSRAEPLAGKALPKSDAAPAAPAGLATADADALQRAREDRDGLIRDLKQGVSQ
ncbi:hypothetical protein MSG28_010477 [Choristoneura fumiferana]|uniref:Uncharacterized protein n=1 Tax=Choristoneura fumiferana TaxID=7141 RepID=A0ACC0KLJ2_CHOFU|nr:hypothetical protein MSG28_010477 [Choristoneura fumiferana]